jgi:hypothetical protein
MGHKFSNVAIVVIENVRYGLVFAKTGSIN